MTSPSTPSTAPKIRPRERAAIIQSLRAGVVPRVGLQHVQVGRKEEVAALLTDLELVKDSAAAVRFVIGRFGSGKSFFLNLASVVALEKGFLVARADITTDRRLHGSNGQARALYAELMKNLASKARPDGNALVPVIEKWIGEVAQEIAAGGGDDDTVENEILTRLRPLQDLVSGFDFARVLAAYYRAFKTNDAERQQNAVRWLRAEYGTKTEAKKDLGVREIIDDADLYDYLKLMGRFARIAGYAGLMVAIDELVVLSHRLASRRARDANYEAILRILNDCLQGQVEGLMVVFGGTDECLEDRRRGLFSYEALATRLAGNQFATESARDLTGPVLRLPTLTAEDLYVLLHRIRHVYAGGDVARYLVPDEALVSYLEVSARTLGEAYFRTPRETVTRFVGFLAVVEGNPDTSWRDALARVSDVEVAPSSSAEAGGMVDDDLVDVDVPSSRPVRRGAPVNDLNDFKL